MRKSLFAFTIVALAGFGTSACATKGFVNRQVGQVSSKVDTLSQSLEETQERTRQNETRLGEVDSKAGAAGTAASQASAAAASADQKAASAGEAATSAMSRAEAVEKASRKIVYEVVLSENQGNFRFGATALPDEAKAAIDSMVGQLLADPKGAYFEIEGHTDNVGDPTTNKKIGQDRAEAVKSYLYEKHQIPLHRMNTISYGEEKPAVENTNRNNRAQNRRVVIRVLG